MRCHDSHMTCYFLCAPKSARCIPDPSPSLGRGLGTRLAEVRSIYPNRKEISKLSSSCSPENRRLYCVRSSSICAVVLATPVFNAPLHFRELHSPQEAAFSSMEDQVPQHTHTLAYSAHNLRCSVLCTKNFKYLATVSCMYMLVTLDQGLYIYTTLILIERCK